jgi:hypothetical protein
VRRDGGTAQEPCVILAAFNRLWRAGADFHLHFIGAQGACPDAFLADLSDLLAAEPIRFRWSRDTNDADVRDALSVATAALFLSEAEGYGLPAVEALAAGCPIIVSSSLPALENLPALGQLRLDAVSVDTVAEAVRQAAEPDFNARLRQEVSTLRLSHLARDRGTACAMDPDHLGWCCSGAEREWWCMIASGAGEQGRLLRCRNCGSEALVETLDLGPQALTGTFPRSRRMTSRSFHCSCCGARPVPCCSWPIRATRHCSTARTTVIAPGSTDRWSSTCTARRTASNPLPARNPGDVVLDIGSNDGTLLSAYRSPGLRLIGIDPTADNFRAFYPAGAAVGSTFFSAEAFGALSERKARIITSIAMFYDLEQPRSFVEQIAQCLDADGIWHFEQSYMPSMLRTTSYDTVCHEHLEYYSLEVVQRMLAEAGLEIADVGFNRVNGGSFAVTACKPESRIPRHAEVVQWLLDQERRIGLDTLAPYQAFAGRVFQHRTDLRDLLENLRRAGPGSWGGRLDQGQRAAAVLRDRSRLDRGHRGNQSRQIRLRDARLRHTDCAGGRDPCRRSRLSNRAALALSRRHHRARERLPGRRRSVDLPAA